MVEGSAAVVCFIIFWNSFLKMPGSRAVKRLLCALAF
jgi:hypothetical protein